MVEWIKPGINIDWVGRFKYFFWFSTAASVAALVIMLINFFVRGDPVNYGTDFKGGSQVQIEFSRKLEATEVRAALAKSGIKDATVVKLTDRKRPHFFMLRLGEVTGFTEAEKARVTAELNRIFGGNLLGLDHKGGSDKVYIRFKREFKPGLPAAQPTSQPASLATSQPASQPAASLATSQPTSGPTSLPSGATAAAAAAADKLVDKQIEDAFKASKVEAAQVQRFGKSEDNTFEVGLLGLDRDIRKIFNGALGAGTVKDVPQVESVGAKMGKQLRDAGIKSVIYSLLLIFLYVALRFDFRYAPGGVISLLHDTFITTGLLALTWTEFSMTAVAALLTLAGYSINDTIVVYDRIRENLVKYRDRKLGQIVNTSINETLSRTILTSFATGLTTLAMWVLGTGEVKIFSFAFTFGILIGTYSSIAVAAPLTLWFNDKFASKKLKTT